MALCERSQDNQGSALPLLLIVVLAAVVIIAVAAALPPINSNSHAVARHGAEAELARQCFDKNGVWKVYYDKTENNYHLLCNDAGKVYDRIIRRTKTGYEEETAFMPKDGAWNNVMRWLDRKGATPYNSPLP